MIRKLAIENILTTLMIVFIAFFSSCVKDDPNDFTNELPIVNVENKSKYSDIISHHVGENCMNCHYKGGTGKGFFSIAGTIYDSTMIHVFPNRMLRLYSQKQEQGEMIAEIEVDGKGNFYTTDTIDFSKGLYVVLYSSSGISKSMQDKVMTGQCSKCHGVTQNNIWIK